jgi:hypothetical protein
MSKTFNLILPRKGRERGKRSEKIFFSKRVDTEGKDRYISKCAVETNELAALRT